MIKCILILFFNISYTIRTKLHIEISVSLALQLYTYISIFYNNNLYEMSHESLLVAGSSA